MSFTKKLNAMTCLKDKCPKEFNKFSTLMNNIHKMSEGCVSNGKLNTECLKKHILKKKRTLVKIGKMINKCMTESCHEHMDLLKKATIVAGKTKSHTRKH